MTWLAHTTSIYDLVHWVQHALYQHGVTNVSVDVDSVRERAWIETRHWIIAIRPRSS